ncbi:HAMP domain-containing histidine kinase [Planctomycetales bacterium ZRK34]|nr:HAMP domain-containing histidine kinase [Planctomycetales bacterium ZRK34]
MAAPLDRLDQAEALLQQLESVETQLRQLQDGLTRSHRLATLGTMASIIAHEFNNILTPMISYCQMAQQAPEDIAMLRKAVDKSLAGALKAASISSSMLGFARDSDEADHCRLDQVLDEVFNCMARPPARDGITLSIHIPENTWLAISPVNLQQVLLNLILNARQVMRKTGGRLNITASRRGPNILLEIADTGPGIPADILADVFKPFVTRRDPDPDATHSRGTGLGLAICRDLVQRAEGAIRVARSDDTGTTFELTIPAAEAPTVIEDDTPAA